MKLEILMDQAIEGLNWELIKHVCLKTKCDWFSIDTTGKCINKGKVDRMAHDAMKQDLKKIIRFALLASPEIPTYVGPWMIEWELNSDNYTKDQCNALTVQFIITAVTVCDDIKVGTQPESLVKKDKEELLTKELQIALDIEDYEKASKLRDALLKLGVK